MKLVIIIPSRIAVTAFSSACPFISGRIIDLQSRLNITNLVENGKVSLPALNQFTKLFDLLGLPAVQEGSIRWQDVSKAE